MWFFIFCTAEKFNKIKQNQNHLIVGILNRTRRNNMIDVYIFGSLRSRNSYQTDNPIRHSAIVSAHPGARQLTTAVRNVASNVSRIVQSLTFVNIDMRRALPPPGFRTIRNSPDSPGYHTREVQLTPIIQVLQPNCLISFEECQFDPSANTNESSHTLLGWLMYFFGSERVILINCA